MQQSNLEPFLKIDTTLAVLSIDRKEPEEKVVKKYPVLEESNFIWNTERTTSFINIERKYDVGYFLTACRLDKYRNIALMF